MIWTLGFLVETVENLIAVARNLHCLANEELCLSFVEVPSSLVIVDGIDLVDEGANPLLAFKTPVPLLITDVLVYLRQVLQDSGTGKSLEKSPVDAFKINSFRFQLLDVSHPKVCA